MTINRVSRREFVASVAACSAGLAVNVEAKVGAAIPKRYKYIDIHTHVGTFFWGKELTVDGLVRLMDLHGVERAVVLPLVSPEASPYPQTSESAIAAHRRYPDRVIPFCCVDPRCLTLPPLRQGHVGGVNGLIDILRQYKAAGCRGLGEHKTGLEFDAKQNMHLYEACQEVGLPILFHLDDIRNPDTPGLPRLEHALKTFPNLPFIGHAAGFWASISGDATIEDFGRYPRIPTPVAPGGSLDRLMDKYPNLYGDLSEPGGYAAIKRDLDFGRDFLIRRADRLLFGTDFLQANHEVPHFELHDSLDLPDEVQFKVFRGNAIRILKLDELQ